MRREETGMFRRPVIAVNNRITRTRRVRVAASEVMLLAPHCLQRTGCDRNLIQRVDECPKGPCRDTRVNVGSVKRALESLIVKQE